MRWSTYYIPTLKEAPADAEVVSHKLLIRAGMIRKLTAGMYNYLPLGWKTIKKVEAIVREEMDRAGALELRLPSVQPGDLWVETGRWEQYGKELLRFHDRHGRDYCLGPTHEEVITDLVRGEIRSYRQLPVNFYQIQTKFRDEIRPRFGLMRGREFIMKDGYSFDRDDAGADKSYHVMFNAYHAIFNRLGLRFRAVEADSGSIGGSHSHEFAVLAQTGEDTIIACSACEYAANIERARGLAVEGRDETVPPAATEVLTPAQHTVEEVSAFLSVQPKDLIKTILLDVDGKPVAALVRGDRELNEIKVKNFFAAQNVNLASPEQVQEWSGAPVGFAGPVGLKVSAILADHELHAREGWVTGANKNDTHLLHVSLARDVTLAGYADLRLLAPGDACPQCGAPVDAVRGIEVGHVFKLGTKYSQSMNAVYLDEKGQEQVMVMGCYGIGVTRVVAACIEQNNDSFGIVFPPSIAPFDVVLLNLDPTVAEVTEKAEALYDLLRAQGLDVLMDDREERPGFKFKDADIIGIPLQLTVGRDGVSKGVVGVKDRRTGEKGSLPLDLAVFGQNFDQWKEGVYGGWKAQAESLLPK